MVPDTWTCPGCSALAFVGRRIQADHDPKGSIDQVKREPTDGLHGPFLRPATPEEIANANDRNKT